MTPTALTLISVLAPTVLALAHSAFVHWTSSKAHPAAVTAAATAAASAATAGATAAIQAMQAGATPKDAAKIAGVSALGTILGPPSPSAVPAPTAGG